MSNIAHNPKFVAALREVIEQEIALQRKYQTALKESEIAVTTLDIEVVTNADLVRSDLGAKMAQAAEKRKELIEEFEEKKLTEVINNHCLEIDKQRLLPLALELRTLAEETQRATRMYNQILDFGGRMINGTLSILTSANQNITRAYSRRGNTVEEVRNMKGDIKEA